MLRTGRLRTPMGLSLHLSPDLHQTTFSSDVSDCWTYTSAHRQRFAQEEGSQQRGVAAWLPA
ncbi:hypothetical protein SAMN05442782_11041 [Streptomyces sp. OK228]|nr:hypothetical protein SAMN05442782_11041 [Streptomyces sp. OK228]